MTEPRAPERLPTISRMIEALRPCFTERTGCVHGEWESLRGDHFYDHALATLLLVPRIRSEDSGSGDEMDRLGAAWARVEAALPEGWVIECGDHPPNPERTYWAQAIGPEVNGRHAVTGFTRALTPAAALLALAEALRPRWKP